MKFIINDKEIEAKKLDVLNLTTDISEVLKTKLMEDAIKMSTMLTGKDKSQFLSDAYRGLPTGNNLMEEAMEYLQSIDGYKWIVKASTGEEDISSENIESYVPVIEFALGIESVESDKGSEDGGDQETVPLEIVEEKVED